MFSIGQANPRIAIATSASGAEERFSNQELRYIFSSEIPGSSVLPQSDYEKLPATAE